MNLNIQFECLGFSQALYTEGYISLAEETVASGRRVGVPGGHDAYFVYQITPELSVWAYHSGDEVHYVAPFFLAGKPVRASVEGFFPFDGAPGRFAAGTSLSGPEAGAAGVRIFPEMLNARLYMDKSGRPRPPQPRGLAIAACLSGGAFALYPSVAEYCGKYDDRPAISESAVVPLRAVDREETQPCDLPFARVTGRLDSVVRSVNEYTREIFFRLDVSAAGLRVPVFAACGARCSDGRALAEIAANAGPAGAIFEGDVYFVCRIL